MADNVKLILDGAALADLLRSPSGPVGRDMIVRATRVQTKARTILAPHRKTGCLEGAIVKRPETVDGELGVRLVADTTSCSTSRTSYALFVHNGTEPHDIPGAFGIPAPFGIGGQYSGKFHPGTKPVPFLKDALDAAGP